MVFALLCIAAGLCILIAGGCGVSTIAFLSEIGTTYGSTSRELAIASFVGLVFWGGLAWLFLRLIRRSRRVPVNRA